MNVESLRKYCLAFPQATENLQWGDDLCFKVGGKIFTVVSLGGSWTGTLTLTATGGPVRYQITVPASYLQDLTVSAPSGRLAAGQSKRVTVTAASSGLFTTAILKLQPGGLGVAISYQIGV